MAGAERLFVGTGGGLLILAPAPEAGRWLTLGRTLEGQAVRALMALDAETVLVAAAGAHPLQSFDGGQSWSEAPGAAVEPLGLKVATARGPMELRSPRLMGATAYARLAGPAPVLLGAGAGGGLLFRSSDDGIHWEPASGVVAGRVTALLPGRGVDSAWAGTDAGQLLRSTDRGVSWNEVARFTDGILCLAAA